MPQLAEEIIKQTEEDKELKEQDWLRYFIEKDTQLDTEKNQLLNGVQTRSGDGLRRAGYNTLRDFFDGDQWQYSPEGGQIARVYNYCRPIVYNFTAFMANEPVDVDVPPSDITDEVEVARSEIKEKVLRDILDDNRFDTAIVEAGALNGSLLGDTIIVGPIYNKKEDKVKLYQVKNPENVKIIWKDDSYREIFGFVWYRYLSYEKAYEQFGEQAEKRGITFKSAPDIAKSSAYVKHQRDLVEFKYCYTDKVRAVLVDDKLLDFEVHDYGFVPISHIVNIPHPEEPWGISDIEDLLDAQTEYNEKNADMSEIIKQTAFPYIFGKNLRPTEVQAGQVNLIDVGDEAEILNDPRGGRSADVAGDIQKRLSDVYQISGLNENVFGGQNVRSVTGRALAVLMQTVNNKIKGRQMRWAIALQEMFANIFVLLEKFTENGKELVGEYYRTDIFFPGTLLRNITDEINKFNAKLQSQESTMKNLGVPSPKDEKKLMKRELEDQMMMVEISRNPGLQIQLHQMMQQQLAEKMAGQKPQLSEDENFDEQPTSMGGAPQQSALGMEGAIRQAGQRAGASTPMEEGG